MALTPIKGTLINLDDVFVSTEDDVRYVTDRYSLWRLDELAGRSKLAQALAPVADGCYTMSAAGAVRPNSMYTSVPTCARLLPDEFGDKLEQLPFVVDYKRDGARLWIAPDGGIVQLDARFATNGFTLRRHSSGSGASPVSVHVRGGAGADDLAGILMPTRFPDHLRRDVERLAAGFGVAREEVAAQTA